MRRSLVLLVPLALASALFACESLDETTPGGDFTPDAGQFDGFAPPPPDTDSGAPGADAGADVDAGPAPVTVQIVSGIGPVAGRLVYFHDATGAVIGSATTGADGKAASTGPTPAQVTALLGEVDGLDRHLVTWTAVEAGDVLVTTDLPRPAGQLDVTLPGAFTDGVAYLVRVGRCLGSTAAQGVGDPVTVDLTSDCATSKNAVLARVRDQETTLAYAFAKGAPNPGPGATAAATVDSWAAPSTVTVTPANVPGDVGTRAFLTEIAGTTAFDGIDEDGSFVVATGFADAYQVGVRASADLKATMVSQRIAPAATITVDLAQALPVLDEVTDDLTDYRRPKIAWTSSAPLDAITDGASVRLYWDGLDGDGLGWTFVLPPTATEVTAPILPKEADAWLLPNPDAGETFIGEPTVVFAEADTLPDAKSFRQIAAAFFMNRSVEYVVLPSNGTLRATWNLQQTF